ncbi:MAG: hypothetical protein M3N49_08270, partial [Candidatus Eremiobacteraeota bacterium]|nr:hypothetical protein [Candidatus Eremiobacteraeota bacterium]
AGLVLAANPATPAMRSAMAVHGLDRVFARSAVPRGEMQRRRSAVAETAWPAFAFMLLVVTIVSVMVVLQRSSGYGGI